MPVALIIANAAVDGCLENEELLGITRNTAERIEAERLALIASRTANEEGKAALATARMLRDELVDTARPFLRITRDILRLHFGAAYSQRWTAAGFHGSLQIPNPPEKVILLLEAMGEFFAENSSLEVAGLQITAVQVKARHAALLSAQHAVKNSDSRVKTLQAAKDEKFRVLRSRLRNLVKELSLILEPLDPRWKLFGLSVPGAKRTPGAPTNVAGTAISDTAFAVKWDPTPRAEYYRVRVRIAGVDEAPKWVGSPSDPDFVLEEMPADKDVEVTVYAVNRTGESVAAMVTRRAGIHQI